MLRSTARLGDQKQSVTSTSFHYHSTRRDRVIGTLNERAMGWMAKESWFDSHQRREADYSPNAEVKQEWRYTYILPNAYMEWTATTRFAMVLFVLSLEYDDENKQKAGER